MEIAGATAKDADLNLANCSRCQKVNKLAITLRDTSYNHKDSAKAARDNAASRP
ncbi:hypothetical protein BH10ACI2_BH10ACI2_02660 [soil metagenome]